MQAVNLAPQGATRQRQDKNSQFADDASYASIERLIKKLTFRCFARVQALGLSMTLDDVEQEMNLTYVRAAQTWRPDGGSRFSTYLTSACLNNFNERVRRPIRDRVELGMVNLSDLTYQNDAGEDMDPLERLDGRGSQQVHASIMNGEHSIEGLFEADSEAMGSNPEEILERRQEAEQGMALLTGKAREIVEELLRSVHAGEGLPKFSDLAARAQVNEAELRRIRVELSRAFGVRI